MTWYFKSDLRYKGDQGWTVYSEEENEKIEKAYKRKDKVVTVNDTYKINLEKLYQFRADDHERQREIKREDREYPKPTSVLGKRVFIVTDYKNADIKVVGVFADEEDAKKSKKQKEDKGSTKVKIVEKQIQ